MASETRTFPHYPSVRIALILERDKSSTSQERVEALNTFITLCDRSTRELGIAKIDFGDAMEMIAEKLGKSLETDAISLRSALGFALGAYDQFEGINRANAPIYA